MERIYREIHPMIPHNYSLDFLFSHTLYGTPLLK